MDALASRRCPIGRRGPKKTPTAILKLRGSTLVPGRADVSVKPELPEPPKALNDRALELFTELSEMLFASRVVTRRDRNALSRYCQLLVQWEEAEEFRKKYGSTIVITKTNTVTGAEKVVGTKMHALVKDSRQLAQLLLRLEAEFGLTPASRAGFGQVAANNSERDSLKARLKHG